MRDDGLSSIGIHGVCGGGSTSGVAHIDSIGIGRSILVFDTFVEALEVESKLQRDELLACGARELDHGEFVALVDLGVAGELAILRNVAQLGGSVLIQIKFLSVVISASLTCLSIQFHRL